MRIIFFLLFSFSQVTYASDLFLMTPNESTRAGCDDLGLTGVFQIIEEQNSAGYQIVFKNHQVNTFVTKGRSEIYRTYFRVVFGGFGEKEVELDLEQMTFLYKDDITLDGEPYYLELCMGTVTVL